MLSALYWRRLEPLSDEPVHRTCRSRVNDAALTQRRLARGGGGGRRVRYPPGTTGCAGGQSGTAQDRLSPVPTRLHAGVRELPNSRAGPASYWANRRWFRASVLAPSPMRDCSAGRPACEGSDWGGRLHTNAGELAAVVGVHLGKPRFSLERDAVDDEASAGLD
jgi:hypothetical protein